VTDDETGDEEYDHSLFEDTMQSQIKDTTCRKVTRTKKGNASGTTVATSNHR